MPPITKSDILDLNTIMDLLDGNNDNTNIDNIELYKNSKSLTKKLAVGSLILMLNTTAFSYAIPNNDNVFDIDYLHYIDKNQSINDFEMNVISNVADIADTINDVDLVFFNKIQKYSENQINLDDDFNEALDELTSELAKRKPSRQRF